MVRGQIDQAYLNTELWEFLERSAAFAIQFDIRLANGEVAAALEIWSKLTVGERQSRHDRLATAAEHERGDVAFEMWSELAESLISHRSRDAYRLASKALVRTKKLLEKEGRSSQWAEYSTTLRARYRRLPALKEELDRAKL